MFQIARGFPFAVVRHNNVTLQLTYLKKNGKLIVDILYLYCIFPVAVS